MTNIKKTLKSQSQDTDGEPMATDTREAAAADKSKKGMKLKILRGQGVSKLWNKWSQTPLRNFVRKYIHLKCGEIKDIKYFAFFHKPVKEFSHFTVR